MRVKLQNVKITESQRHGQRGSIAYRKVLKKLKSQIAIRKVLKLLFYNPEGLLPEKLELFSALEDNSKCQYNILIEETVVKTTESSLRIQTIIKIRKKNQPHCNSKPLNIKLRSLLSPQIPPLLLQHILFHLKLLLNIYS